MSSTPVKKSTNARWTCVVCGEQPQTKNYVKHFLDKHPFQIWSEQNLLSLNNAIERRNTILCLKVPGVDAEQNYSGLNQHNYKSFERLMKFEETLKTTAEENRTAAVKHWKELKTAFENCSPSDDKNTTAQNMVGGIILNYYTEHVELLEQLYLMETKLNLMKQAYEKATECEWTEEDEETLCERAQEIVDDEPREREEMVLFSPKEEEYYKKAFPTIILKEKEALDWLREFNKKRKKKPTSSSNAK